jgi:hypothetical protein
MKYKFKGGPYDGREIDHTLLNQHAQIALVTGDLGSRNFVLMPSPDEWQRLLRGDKVKAKKMYPYEGIQTPDSFWFQWIEPEAYDRAVSESRLKVNDRARPALAILAEAERRQVIEATDALQRERPDHWPETKVVRLTPEEPVYLLRVSPDLRAFVRVQEPDQLELLDIVRPETLKLFRGNS